MRSLITTILAFIFLLLPESQALATPQAPERIIVNGKKESLHNNPLRPYLAAHPDAFPKSNTEIELVSSGNWRGYVGTWEILNNTLYLRKVEAQNHDPSEIIGYLFPNKKDVVATWYSGTLVIPRGKRINYVHLGYGSTFQRYLVITVKDGTVVTTKKLSAKKFLSYRHSKFLEYKNTELYRSKLGEYKKQELTMTDEEIEDFIYSIDSEYYLSL